jgi:hypothetical protein
VTVSESTVEAVEFDSKGAAVAFVKTTPKESRLQIEKEIKFTMTLSFEGV